MKPLGSPRELGSYRLLAELGRGAMGVVFLAAGPDGEVVALKQVRPQFLDDDEFRARFRREVDASSEVSSRYTAKVLDSDVDAELPWLVSEFISGPTLDAALEGGGPLPEETVLGLAKGLAQALVDIHAGGVIHRDLKPSNVILADDGPRVIDFGIAKATETEGGTDLTRTSWLVGTVGYMSPEQAEGDTVTPASDMFSLATVLYVAATGSNPFNALKTMSTLYKVVHFEPDLTEVPPRLREILEPCWAKDPQSRPSAAALLDMLGPPDSERQPWPAAVGELTRKQRSEVDDQLACDVDPAAGTVRFHDGGTRLAANTAAMRTGTPPLPELASRFGSQMAKIAIGILAAVLCIIGITAIVDDANKPSDDGDGDTGYSDNSETTDDFVDDSETTHEYELDTEPKDDIVGVWPGQCVDGPPEDGTNWDIELECDAGTFEVVDRFDYIAELEDCPERPESDTTVRLSESVGDMTLCLAYQWEQGDIGHTEVGLCLDKSGEDDNARFEFTSCTRGNVVVVDRTSEYDVGESFCSGYGWATARNEEFDLSYTVCYRDY